MQLRHGDHLAGNLPTRPAFGDRDAVQSSLSRLQFGDDTQRRNWRREVILAGLQRGAFTGGLEIELQWPLVFDNSFSDQSVDNYRRRSAFGYLDVLAVLAVADWVVQVGINPRSGCRARQDRSEEHTSELQSRFGISYAVFCLKKKKLARRDAAVVNENVSSPVARELPCTFKLLYRHQQQLLF